jgi:hypothetical protein
VAGNFNSINGVAANAVAKYNGSSWSALGWTATETGYAVTVKRDGTVFLAHAHTPNEQLSYYNGTSWTNIDWYGNISNSAPTKLFLDKQDRLWAGVNDGFAYWNGTQIIESPFQADVSYTLGAFQLDKDGNMWVGASLTSTPDGTRLPDYIGLIVGNSSVIPPDIDFPGTIPPKTVVELSNGDIYIGGEFSGSATSSAVTANSNSSAVTYPVLKITGPGTVWSLRNYTTGKMINFNGLVLTSGETLELSLKPENVYAKTSLKGNILGYLGVGTDYDFPIVPGTNSISLFMTGTTGSSEAFLLYSPSYWSLDGATR